MLLAAISAMLVISHARAADSVTVTVNATVSGVCKFNSGQSPIVTIQTSGGVIDPSAAGPATGNANVLYRCTNGTSPTFNVPATATITCTTSGTCGSSTMAPTMSGSGNAAGTGMGSGQDKTLVVTGQLTSAQYANAQAGDYSGTISVTVTP
jgi:hypothetical protein